jgi:hypothetical protein
MTAAHAAEGARRLFALDQNFPEPIVDALTEYQEAAELVPLRVIDERLSDVDDWQILLALHHHERPWDGVITTDTSMLNQPLELAVLIQTKLTLVAVREAGHNPVKACGLLFAYLEGICQRTRSDRPQVWSPAAAQRAATDPWDELTRVAKHQHVGTSDLFEAHRLTAEQIAQDPLGSL